MSVQLGLFDVMQLDPAAAEPPAATYARRLDDLAYADELGFDFAFTAEHHYLPRLLCAAPSVWIAAASQRTKRMRLGVLAYTLPLHNPVALAEEIAVLDQLSNGRMEVGVGLGRRREELLANGIDADDRIAIFQERLAVMEALWTGGQVTLTGRSVSLNEVVIHPLPLQEPAPPLWFEGADATGATWAGSRGMNLAVGFAPLRDLVPAVAGFKGGRLAREEMDASGERAAPGGRIALIQSVYVAETDDAARLELHAGLERIAALDPASAGRSREERSEAAAVELRRLLDAGILLIGSPETVANGIRFARRALGIDSYLANVWLAGVEPERVRRSLRLLASDVRERVAREPVEGQLDVTTRHS